MAPSTSPFALRYPKTTLVGLSTALSATTKIGPGLVIMDRDLGIPVAPARYTAMRKVTFFAHIRYNGAATTLPYYPFVGYSAIDAVIDIPKTYNVALNSVVSQITPDPLWKFEPGTFTNRYFTARGPGVSVAFNGGISTNTRTYIVGITFDIANNSHADFWSVWNTLAATGDKDRYMMFYIGLDSLGLASDSDIAQLVIFSQGMTVVQAPTRGNATCTTIISAPSGGETNGYREVFSTGTDDALPWTWQYNVNEWDGLFSINGFTLGRNLVPVAPSIQFQLARIQPTFSSLATETHNPEHGGVSGGGFIARSSDILPLLVDGETYIFEWKRGTAQSINTIATWIEIIQENLSITTTYHDASSCVSSSSIYSGSTFTTITDYAEQCSSYFDPQWYRNMLGRISKSKFYGGIQHNSAGNDPMQLIAIDPNIESDSNQLTSPSIVFVGPDVSGTPTATLGVKIKRQDITANSPVVRAGPVRFMWSKNENHIWNAGANDIAGHLGIYYTFTVPETEVPELGPVFELDAFNPEGCASTAAGGGDPGILAITNGSVPPVKFNPAAQSIEELGIQAPFEGEVPTATQQAVLQSPAGLGLSNGTYAYRYTLLNCCTGRESDPNPDDIVVEVTAGGGGFATAVTLSFANVVIPGDPQVCKICVYRTTNAGIFPVMAKVGCFDPNVTSLFVDTFADAQLDFQNDGLSILNGPPPCAPIVVEFKDRLFMMGDIPLRTPTGTVSVVSGSKYVVGSFDVEWDRCLEGKFLQLDGDCRPYEIERVLPPVVGTSPAIQRLKLVEDYAGNTTSAAFYTICGHTNRLWFSEPFEPEYWPAISFIDIEPGDGDRIMGGCSNFDRLVICKRRKTYVLAFSDTPAEVFCPARVSSDIGCVGPRTFAQVESGTVWLAERGIALYDGRGVQHIEASDYINEIFTDPDNPRYVRKDINGRVIDAVGVFYPKRQQYLLLLPTVQTNRGCDLLLVWDIKCNAITLHEFCQQFQSMVVAKDADGNERVYVGDTNGFVWLLDVGGTDGAGTPGRTGTVQGTVSSAGFDDSGAAVLDDVAASFVEGGLPGLAGLSGLPGFSGAINGGDLGLAGVCLFVRPDENTPWTQRTIFAATQTRLYVTPAWASSATPSLGWQYLIAPIEFLALFKPTDLGSDDDTKRDWRVIIYHEPETADSIVKIELLPDFQDVDPDEGTQVQPDGAVGPRQVNLNYAYGKQVMPVGRQVFNTIAVRLSQFAPEAPIRLINFALCAEGRTSK